MALRLSAPLNPENVWLRRMRLRHHQGNRIERRHGSILAEPDACFVMMMALPFGSTRALPAAHAIKPDHLGNAL
jgi:hypothetical protein